MKTIDPQKNVSAHWLSDLHLDKASKSQIDQLLVSIKNTNADIIAITGDTSNSLDLEDHLTAIAKASAPRPVYMVCGNHDYYGSSIADVNTALSVLCDRVENLHHLNGRQIIPLQRDICLIGLGGWADARAGYGLKTYVRSPDHHAIRDFRELTKKQAMNLMREMGKESAKRVREILPLALSSYRHVILLTHTPPFATCVRYNGAPCGPLHLPHFTNVSAGLVIRGIGRAFPKRKMTILAGHTHCADVREIEPNIIARVAHARTGKISQPMVLKF
jgi:predicted MPP superfamily phosphohydrolase